LPLDGVTRSFHAVPLSTLLIIQRSNISPDLTTGLKDLPPEHQKCKTPAYPTNATSLVSGKDTDNQSALKHINMSIPSPSGLDLPFLSRLLLLLHQQGRAFPAAIQKILPPPAARTALLGFLLLNGEHRFPQLRGLVYL
jgi:hypothetical protein